MDNALRCKCGKIVCQLEEQVVTIKCRHCKRLIIMKFDKHEDHDNDNTPQVKQPKIEYR